MFIAQGYIADDLNLPIHIPYSIWEYLVAYIKFISEVFSRKPP